MKRVILLCVAVTGLALLAGCEYDRQAAAPRCLNNNCVDFPEGGAGSAEGAGSVGAGADRDPGRCGLGLGGRRGAGMDDGPATAGVAYPYYTVRGPRDFLQKSPTPIGP
jgi:hypothetical protein